MKTVRAGLVTILAGALAVLPAEAQEARPGPEAVRSGADMMMRGGGLARHIELALEHREELELSDDQVASLEELSEAVTAAREAVREDMESLRERIRDDELERTEVRQEMQALRERARESHAPYRERFQELLTLEQGNELRRLAVRQWAGQRMGRPMGPRGPRAMMRGPRAPRGAPMMRRGLRRGGPAFRGRRGCGWDHRAPWRGFRGGHGPMGRGLGWGFPGGVGR